MWYRKPQRQGLRAANQVRRNAREVLTHPGKRWTREQECLQSHPTFQPCERRTQAVVNTIPKPDVVWRVTPLL